MLTLFVNPRLPTSAGTADFYARLSVLKVAVVAAAAELLRLAGESADGVMPLSGYDKEPMTAICKLKDDASRARCSAATKAVSVTDLSDFKRFVKIQYAIGLYTTNGKPRCDAAARRPSETASGLVFALCRSCGLIGRCERTKLQRRGRFRRGGW
jgi:hypothetical protein